METLNRQQLLYQRQNDLQKQVAEQQDLKRRAQQLVNEALLRDDIAAKQRNEQEFAQVKQLLSSSYSMPGRSLVENQAIINESQQLSPKSMTSPRLMSRSSLPGQNTLSRAVPVAPSSSIKSSALEQLLRDGKVSETPTTSRSSDMVNPYGQSVISPYQLAASSLYLPSPPGGTVAPTGTQQLATDDKEKLIQAVRDELQRLQPS